MRYRRHTSILAAPEKRFIAIARFHREYYNAENRLILSCGGDDAALFDAFIYRCQARDFNGEAGRCDNHRLAHEICFAALQPAPYAPDISGQARL